MHMTSVGFTLGKLISMKLFYNAEAGWSVILVFVNMERLELNGEWVDLSEKIIS